jgi:polar amino acid transport system substrate-binding protein
MNHTVRSIISLVLIAAFLLISGCTDTRQGGQTGTPATQPPAVAAPAISGTAAREQMVAFVDEAVAYARANGKEKALAEFSNRNGSFVRGELYLYAYDFNGTTIAHPVNPEKIGVNRLYEKDATGSCFIKNLRDAAINGSGFVSYTYINPVHNNTIEQKLGYVRKVDENWWLGSGIYYGTFDPALPATSGAPGTMEDLKSFVRSAADYCRENGKAAALASFNNKSGRFVKGNVYIYALDFGGNVLALPFQPDLVGTNFLNMSDAAGQKFVQSEIAVVQDGGGFVSFMYPNPARSFAIEPKISYVEKVDDTYWIGAGLYVGDNIQADDRAVRFVHDAKTFAEKNGRPASLAAFNNRTGPFITGDLYIFAYDYNGTTLAYPFRPDLIGVNRLDATDPLGKYHIRAMAEAARTGSGVVWYLSENPYRNNATEIKVSYVQDIDGSYFIGAGTYVAPGPAGAAAIPDAGISTVSAGN